MDPKSLEINECWLGIIGRRESFEKENYPKRYLPVTRSDYDIHPIYCSRQICFRTSNVVLFFYIVLWIGYSDIGRLCGVVAADDKKV